MNHTKTDRIWPARLFAFPILQLKFSTQRWAVPTEVCPNCNSMSKANALFEATEFRSNLLCSYCCCSVAQLCLTLCHPMDCSTPGFLSFTISRSLLRLMSIESVMPSNHLILCCPLLLLPSIFPSIRVFSNKWVLHIKWPSIGVSVSASVLTMNIQDWSPSGWTGLVSLQSKGTSKIFNTTFQKHQFFSTQLSL